MTKVFLATPSYEGKVHLPYAISLAETHTLLASKGIETVVRINALGSLLVAERNRLIKQFLETDCSHLLCVDSDLGWPCYAVTAMLDKDVDFVAGVYPTRRERTFLFRPKLNEDGSIIKSDKNLLAMEFVPAGFMLIKRYVIEKMIRDNPELYFKPKDTNASDGHCLFNTVLRPTNDGLNEFWGEDYEFCRLVIKSGFEIWVDPLIQFDHAGVIGALIETLTDKKPETVDAID